MPTPKRTTPRNSGTSVGHKYTSAPKDTVSKRTPVKTYRAQVAPHVKTLSNGQPRPKRRG